MRLYKRGKYWHAEVGVRGKYYRKSTKRENKRAAEKWAAKWVAALEAGRDPFAPEQLRFSELLGMLEAHYKVERNRSIDRVRYAFKHLERYFADHMAIEITTREIRAYQAMRLDEGAAANTIRNEVSYLRAALRLADADGLIPKLPSIPLLSEPDPRDVTLHNDGEFVALLDALPEHHRGWVATAGITGWRKRGVLSRERRHIVKASDGTRWLVLDRSKSKNAQSYEFPIVGDLARVIDDQLAYLKGLEKRAGKVVRWLFCYPDGRPIKYPDQAFKNAAKAIGRPELHIHDLRRYAATRMTDRGIPEVEAKRLLGMESRSIFERYNIENEDRKVRAVEKMAGALDAEPEGRPIAIQGRT